MYRWARRAPGYEPLARRLPPPAGFARVAAPRGSYAHWLRHLPLLPAGTPVRSYQGRVILPAGHRALAAVVDLDVGRRDRQQCADTVMRLRGEYLHWRGRADRVRFRWAGGRRFGFQDWRRGLRPVKQDRTWSFEARARPGRGYRSFRNYLSFISTWTGSLHLAGEPRVKPDRVQPGDFFNQGGSPGHTVVVLDVARGPQEELRLLVGQGFMPAQDLHLLRGEDGSPWFRWDPRRPRLKTPLWKAFGAKDLRRFKY
jgi:hypothetical protein